MTQSWWTRLFGRPSTKSRTRPLLRLAFEELEPRCVPTATGFRPITEVGNNLANPTWGTANTDLLRYAAAAYADGLNAPSLAGDQSARAISNLVNSQADPNNPGQDLSTVDQQSLSDFGYAFGQFMDHDMDLTPDGGTSLPITVPAGDPIGPNALPFNRSQYDPKTGLIDPTTQTDIPRQQVNVNTSYLDLSQVYGSTQAVADALRTFHGGRLKTSPGDMLPYNNTTYFTADQLKALNMANDAHLVPDQNLFAAGDRRANETLELTALQTLFVRNHNRLAAQLHAENPTWGDEKLYQEARKLNIAEYQYIVYTQYLPAVLGPNALPAYTGYQPGVNAGIANEFSTVAFRFGHSLLSGNIERHTNQGVEIADVNPAGASIPLSQDFFDPNLLSPDGVVDTVTGHTSSDIGAVLKASADGDAQAMDVMAINDVRNLLFGGPGAGGQDLIARDVQRGRDNGIPDYNTLRVALGLPAVTSYAQISSDPAVQAKLLAAYGQTNGQDNVNLVDAFEGGMAEDHVPGADVGPLFRAIMVKQFAALRDGDRFFYLNENFNRQELSLIQRGDTLAKVIEANTSITNLQSNVFFFKASISGTVYLQGQPHGRSGPQGVPGITVRLEDTSGNVLAMTVTDSQGRYSFNQLSGPAANPDNNSGISAAGYYRVVLVLPSGMTQKTPNPSSILIGRGGMQVSGINFGVDFSSPAWVHALEG